MRASSALVSAIGNGKGRAFLFREAHAPSRVPTGALAGRSEAFENQTVGNIHALVYRHAGRVWSHAARCSSLDPFARVHASCERIMALSEQLLSELRGLLGPANVLTSAEDLIPYSFDGTAALQQMPGAVVFVTNTAQISVLPLRNAFR